MKKIFLSLILLMIALSLRAEGDYKDAVKKGLEYQLGDSKDNFFKFGIGTQLWMRYTELNPGVVDAANKEIKSDFDILLRRNYFNTFVVVDRFTFFAMFALTSQGANVSTNPGAEKKESIFMYDAFGSYAIIPKHLTMGFGLNMYSGISRYNTGSTGKSLGTDLPLALVPNVIGSEQAVRRLNLFATGMTGTLAYSFSLYKSFIPKDYSTVCPPANNIAGDYRMYNLGYTTKLELQLLDKEPPNRLPFKSSTYLGAKRVFNIGVGIDYLPEGTMSYLDNMVDIELHDKFQIAADIFFDTPLKNKAAFNAYVAYLYTDFGPNYLQSFGNQDIWGGSAITEHQNGTGQVIHGQVSYALPKFKNSHQLQAYCTATYKDFEAVDETMVSWSTGLNYYLIGHKLKFSLEYLNRPYVYDYRLEKGKSQVVGKMQFAI